MTVCPLCLDTGTTHLWVTRCRLCYRIAGVTIEEYRERGGNLRDTSVNSAEKTPETPTEAENSVDNTQEEFF